MRKNFKEKLLSFALILGMSAVLALPLRINASSVEPEPTESSTTVTEPSSTTQSDTSPSDTNPSDTTPSDSTPPDTSPSKTTPSDTTPSTPIYNETLKVKSVEYSFEQFDNDDENRKTVTLIVTIDNGTLNPELITIPYINLDGQWLMHGSFIRERMNNTTFRYQFVPGFTSFNEPLKEGKHKLEFIGDQISFKDGILQLLYEPFTFEVSYSTSSSSELPETGEKALPFFVGFGILCAGLILSGVLIFRRKKS